MKCTVFLAATFVLMLCGLFAGCTSPTEATIKPIKIKLSNHLFLDIP